MSMAAQSVIEEVFEKYPRASRDTLIPILQSVQEKAGYLSQDAIAEVGRRLKLSSGAVYGVATFYNQFRFQPLGKYHFMLCRGTACHVKGSKKLLDHVIALLGIQPGQTSRDKLFSLEVVACMGACGLAPAISLNGEVHAKVTPRKLTRLVESCRAMGEQRIGA
ncbi:MAG: NADH-quinone oxidoreductase subunit NuoE [Polyangia bacterium]|jgi:NADH-quinone oxidoreductase subunit E|nr:NADH-quinone oxidoreductase subunit NuoE [Polyangia bacterium]